MAHEQRAQQRGDDSIEPCRYPLPLNQLGYVIRAQVQCAVAVVALQVDEGLWGLRTGTRQFPEMPDEPA